MTKLQERGSRAEHILIKEFIKDLEITAEQVQKLLEEIRDSKIDFASIKTEINFLVGNVKDLSTIIRDGNGAGSILTRLALIERSIEELKIYVSREHEDDIALIMKTALLEQKIEILNSFMEEKKKDEIEKAKQSETDKAGKWKLYAAIATGAFTFLGTVAAIIMSLL